MNISKRLIRKLIMESLKEQDEKTEQEAAVDNFMSGLNFGDQNKVMTKSSAKKQLEKFKEKLAKKKKKTKEVDDFFSKVIKGIDFGDAGEGDKVKADDLEKLVADKIEDSPSEKAVADVFAKEKTKTADKVSADQKEKTSDDDVEEITFEYDSLDRNTARTVIKKAYEHFIKVKKKQKDPKYKDLIRDLDRKAKGYRALALDDTKGGIYSEFLGSKVREEMLDYFDDNSKAAAKYLKARGKQYDLNDAFVSYTDILRKKFTKGGKEQLGDKAKESDYGDDENQDYSREKYLKESKSYGLSRGSLYRIRYRRY